MLEIFWNLKYLGLVWEELDPFSQENSEMVENRQGAVDKRSQLGGEGGPS